MSDFAVPGIILFLVGACWGSFANVVIYRWPKGESVVSPGSHCGACGKPVRWYYNIPIFSYLMLRGHCAECGAKFSPRYMFVELLTALLFVTAGYFFGWSWMLLEVLIFIVGLVCCTFIDIDHFLLPDVITLSGLAVGLVGAALNPERSFLDALGGAVLGGGILWAVATIYYLIRKEEGMGGGDIKLLAWIGAILGWKSIPFVILSASVVGSILGLALAWRAHKGLKTVIPFGPYLAAGALLWLFGGESFGLWYLRLFFPAMDVPV